MQSLRPARLHFGWRVVDDVLDYTDRVMADGGATNLAAVLDDVVYAKVLPKLRGDDSPRFREALKKSAEVLNEHRLENCVRKVKELSDDLESTGSSILAIAVAGESTDLHVRSLRDIQPGPTSWRIGQGDVAVGFCEGGKYRIRKTGEGDRLSIDDEILETDGGDYWVWSPGFYAGQVRAELLGPGDRVRATFVLDVSPHPGKLGRDTFEAMLDQIRAFDPGLVLGTEPAALPVGHEAAISDPWLEYARLRAYGDKFVRALSAISRQPLRELRAERAHLPLPQVRRADRQTALAALGSAQLLNGAGRWRTRPDYRTGAMPHFDVPVARETLDGAANRCVAAIAHEVSRRAVRLRDELESIVEKEPESMTRTASPPGGRVAASCLIGSWRDCATFSVSRRWPT